MSGGNVSSKPRSSLLGRLFRGRNNQSSSSKEEEVIEPESSASVSVIEMFEHERWRDQMGWSARNLDIGDPQRYLSSAGPSDTLIDPPLQAGWVFDGPWYICQ